MIARYYRFKFYLNARHVLNLEAGRPIHPHTWEIAMLLVKEREDFVQFNQIEDRIQSFLKAYENTLLNELPSFQGIEPSTEAIGEVFFRILNQHLSEIGWKITSIEVSENSSRTYAIEDKGYYFEKFNPLLNPPLEDRNQRVPSKYIIDFPLSKLKTEEAPFVALEDEPEISTPETDAPRVNQEAWSEQHLKMRALSEKIKTKSTEVHKEQVPDEKKHRNKGVRTFLWCSFTLMLYAGALIGLYTWIFRTGQYPWGSDTWGHLFKGHFLYQEFSKGNYYPLYTNLWYNGIQPFRYWAPIPYYLLLGLEWVTGGDSLKVYNVFIGLVFILGSIPWLIIGRKLNKPYLGTLLGLVWFILPDNLRVFFCEGNLPRVVVTTLFPYLLMGIMEHLETKKRSSLLLIYGLMVVITLCHAMISAMTGITIFIFLLGYGAVYRKVREPVMILTSMFLGILTTGVWLYPALKGGIVLLDSTAASAMVDRLTYYISQSLNPMMRTYPELSDAFYFGISILFVACVGLLVSNRFSKLLFAMVIIVFLGTTKVFIPIIRKLPMSDLFWMMRFTPMAMAFALLGLLKWEKIKRYVLYIFVGVFIIEGLFTLNVIKLSLNEPRVRDEVKEAVAFSSQRIAMLDLGKFDSDPTFEIAYGSSNKQVQQIYGWAWQGATTAENIVWINTALTKGYYAYVFDRCLEMGADTLVFKKALIEDRSELIKAATALGYSLVNERENNYLFHYPSKHRFATQAKYSGLAIGKTASNITYAFPSFQTAKKPFIDAYTVEELLQYKTIFLSGFEYQNKAAAENLISAVGERGVRVVVDLAGQDSELLSGRAEFMGILCEPVQFIGKMPKLELGSKSYVLNDLPKELATWNTFHLVIMDHTLGSSEFAHSHYDFWGTKASDNIHFVAFNLPYYLSEAKDQSAIKVMEAILGIKADTCPTRQVVEVKEVRTGANELSIEAPKGTILDMAALDAFEASGNYEVVHNLIKTREDSLTIKVTYPYFRQGALISMLGILAFVVFQWILPCGIYLVSWRKKGKALNEHA